MNFIVSGFFIFVTILIFSLKVVRNILTINHFIQTQTKKYKKVIPIILNGTLSISVRDHMLDCNHSIAWNDFKVLGRKSNNWLLEAEQSLFKRLTFNL